MPTLKPGSTALNETATSPAQGGSRGDVSTGTSSSFSVEAQVGSRVELQHASPTRPHGKGALPDGSKAGPLYPQGVAAEAGKASAEGNLQGKVQDLMSQYMKGTISQGELVRQLKMVNNVLAHNMVKEAKQALGGSMALATSPEHQSQLPQSRSLLEDSATNVKAAGVEETGPPPPEKADSAYGAMGNEGALSTEHDKQQEEQQQQKQEEQQQALAGIISDRETNEQAQQQRFQQISEQNARDAQDKQRQIQEQQREKDAQTQDIAGKRGTIGEFLRTASKASAQKEKYLQRSKSRASVGTIPRIDQEVSLGAQVTEQSLVQSTRDSHPSEGEEKDEALRPDKVIEPNEDPIPDWFKPVDDTKW